MSNEFTRVTRYNLYKIETKDVFLLFGLGAFAATAFKYLDRCGYKDTVEENLNKSLYYLKACIKCNRWVPQITFPINQEELRRSVTDLINPGTNQFLNRIGLMSASGYLQTSLVEAVIQDRTTGGTLYGPVMSLLLNGQFEGAYNMLQNLMNHFDIKIHK